MSSVILNYIWKSGKEMMMIIISFILKDILNIPVYLLRYLQTIIYYNLDVLNVYMSRYWQPF